MIVVDLSKQQAVDADPKAIQHSNFTENAIQHSNFTGNLDRAGNTKICFILQEAKGTVLDFLQGTVKVLYNAIK